MSYIYHLKPNPQEGPHLLPLNLMDKDSSLYLFHAKKYEGRRELMSQMIPKLNCKWNDVIQCSALDPQILMGELKKFDADLKLNLEYYKIHLDQIIPEHQAVVFKRNPNQQKGDYSISEDDVQFLSFETYQELQAVPERTLQYWQNMKETGGKFLWFPHVPHIFIKGKLDTTHFEVCKLSV